MVKNKQRPCYALGRCAIVYYNNVSWQLQGVLH